MSPKQSSRYPLAEEMANNASSIAAAERLDGRPGGVFELMRFTLRQMNEQLGHVRELEAANGTVRDRVLDSLVDMAHVAHRFLRHDDPDIRQAAEALTTGTAHLISRMYAMVGAATTRISRAARGPNRARPNVYPGYRYNN